MSVRAYIVYTELSEVNFVVKRNALDQELHCVERIQYEDDSPLFNIWRHGEIFDLIRYNGYDATDNNGCGEIGIDANEFKEALQELNTYEFKKLLNIDDGYGFTIINKLYMYLEDNDFIVLNCY